MRDSELALFRKEFLAFIAGDARNQHIFAGDAVLYVRKSLRFFRIQVGAPPQAFHALDLASLDVSPEVSRGRGLGGALLTLFHEENPVEASFIENVVNSRFADYLLRHGWTPTGTRDLTPSFFKLTGKTAKHTGAPGRLFARHSRTAQN